MTDIFVLAEKKAELGHFRAFGFFPEDDRGAPIGVSAVTGAIGAPRIFLRK